MTAHHLSKTKIVQCLEQVCIESLNESENKVYIYSLGRRMVALHLLSEIALGHMDAEVE